MAPARVTVFPFNDRVLYPALYTRAHRANANHLNYEGSAEYSRALAGRFADHLDLIAAASEKTAVD